MFLQQAAEKQGSAPQMENSSAEIKSHEQEHTAMDGIHAYIHPNKMQLLLYKEKIKMVWICCQTNKNKDIYTLNGVILDFMTSL